MGTVPNKAMDFYLNQELKTKTKWKHKKPHQCITLENGDSRGKHVSGHSPAGVGEWKGIKN